MTFLTFKLTCYTDKKLVRDLLDSVSHEISCKLSKLGKNERRKFNRRLMLPENASERKIQKVKKESNMLQMKRAKRKSCPSKKYLMKYSDKRN